jgi:hypothetical protein
MKRTALAALFAAASFIGWKAWPDAAAPQRKTATRVADIETAGIGEFTMPGGEPGGSGPVGVDKAGEILAQRPDTRWQQPVPEPEFADFKQWATEFADGRRSLEAGVKLARERRAALTDLISKDPRRALELAVPESVRCTLPPAVQVELEERVSGRGDLLVAAAVPLSPQHRTAAVERRVSIQGREYEVFTYGNRESAMSRQGLGIHGIALDGKLALSEWPARFMEPVEIAAARGKLPSPPLCRVSGAVIDANGDEVVLDWSLEQAQWYCQAAHAMEELLAAAAAEAALPPQVAAGGLGGGGADLPPPPSGYTEGSKSMLLIRVDFPDKPGQVVTDATLTNLIDSMADHWTRMSYGKLNWKRAGEGSRFTPTLRLPGNHASYTSLNSMLSAARAAAEDAGFDYRDYSFEVVVTGDKPDVSFGGIAYIGERGAWLANGQWNLGMCSHELGHNFGLNHSGFWRTNDGTPNGVGSNVDYGNPFDHMGGASSSTSAHFNARQKHYLGWLTDSSVQKLSAEGMVSQRLLAFDRDHAAGTRAIAVDRSGTAQDYWIEYRSLYPLNDWLNDGLVMNFGDANLNNAKPSLLDFTPMTSTRDDCSLLTGRTFSDWEHGIHITPTERGVDVDGVPFIDVTVNRGVFAGNRKPAATLSFSPVNPAVNATVNFTVTASDPDGDALSCFWDWGDGSFTANSARTNSHRWSTAGIRTVRCTVSDMKGGTTTASAVVETGAASTFFLSGLVRAAGGAPLEGVTVSAGGRSDVTDSEGFYAVTGLGAGSYTVTAAKSGFGFTASGFSNPVILGPSVPNVDFIAPRGVPVFGTMKPAKVDAGSNTGAVPLPLTDRDTPVTSLRLTAVSSRPEIVPHSHIAFAAADAPTITVTAPGAAGGAVEISITATDPEGGSSTCVWPVTVNGPPVHAIGTFSTPENTPLDIDLRTLVSDDLTPAGDLAFRIDRVRNGSAELLADGRSARFIPAPGFNGGASFRLVSRDRSLDAATVMLYDFEPDAQGDIIRNGTVPDLSNFNRSGTLESAGNGEYSAVADVPSPLAPHSTAALNLTETSSGAARRTCSYSASELNWNDSDWTFCAWVKRNHAATEDFVFHFGGGDGHGPQEELHLSYAAGSQELRLQKFSAAGAQAGIVQAGIPAGEWHHVSVTFDRTAMNTGTLALFVDGFLAGAAPDVVMALDQTRGAVFGGHAESTEITRWMDGRLDDVMIAGAVLSRAQLRALATMGAAHVLGLSATDTVPVNVTGANDAPTLAPPADTGMNPGAAFLSLAFKTGDAESEARTLTVTGTSSNTALIPHSGIAISSPPPAWSSADIGVPDLPGDTVEDHGTFIIRGGGSGIGGAADTFHFVRQELTGDSELICRVVSLEGPNARSSAGLMLRAGAEAATEFAMVCITAADGVQFSSRSSAGSAGNTAATVNFIAAPVWLRLVRSGSSVSGYFAPEVNGAPGLWQTIDGATGFIWPATLQAGMAITGSDEALPATAVVDNIGGKLKSGGERVVTLTPVAGQTGISTITLSVSDGEDSTAGSFLAVVGVNTPPTVTSVPDISITSGTAPEAFTVLLSDLHTAASALTITASSSDSRLLPDNRIVITGAGAQRSVQLRPVPGETGSATITLSVNDGTATTPVTFTLTVHPGDPALLILAGTNWRYLDSGTAPPDWNTVAFNDAAWSAGPAQLGFGDGDESTLLIANPSRRTTYFRRPFTLTDPDLYPWLQLRVLRDDGAVVYLNGQELWRTNLPEGLPVTPSTDALLAVEGADERSFHPFTVRRAPFVAGVNVLAVEVHQKGTAGNDLSFDLEARGAPPSPIEAVSAGAVWSYLDTGEDPGNGWTDILFADSAWKSGAAQLGYGDGDETTVIAAGPENAHFVTSYFRKQFAVPDGDDIAGIGLRMLRDDGIQVWLNGQVLHRDNLPPGAAAATLAENTIGPPAESEWQSTWLPPNLLRNGINQLAAEVHQSSLTSADASFDLQLLLYTHDSLPPLHAKAADDHIILTWPLWARAWHVQSSAGLHSWTDETAAPVAGANAWNLTLPRTAERKYFRLALP